MGRIGEWQNRQATEPRVVSKEQLGVLMYSGQVM